MFFKKAVLALCLLAAGIVAMSAPTTTVTAQGYKCWNNETTCSQTSNGYKLDTEDKGDYLQVSITYLRYKEGVVLQQYMKITRNTRSDQGWQQCVVNGDCTESAHQPDMLPTVWGMITQFPQRHTKHLQK